MKPTALVIRTAGTNCDGEMCRAFELAGARVELIHVDRLAADPAPIARAELIGLPGGFSHGDDLGAGRVFAVKLRERLYPALRDAADRGALMIGACNGFQVLVQTGLLPGRDPGVPDAGAASPAQDVALAANANGRFIDAWVRVAPVAESVCLWTRGLDAFAPEAMQLPIAHGEGRFLAADDAIIKRLERRGQVALRYVDNLNGSTQAIAGLCDSSGRIFGLMPHPERYLSWLHHPFWTSLPEAVRHGRTPGLAIFENAVATVRAGLRAGAHLPVAS